MCLVGVVVRRYIHFLTLLIPTPLVSALFGSSIPTFLLIFNPRRACARVTVLVLSVCLCVCVCVFPILAPPAIRRTNSSISNFSAIQA